MYGMRLTDSGINCCTCGRIRCLLLVAEGRQD